MSAPLLPLNDGHAIPQIGLGTWPMDDAEAERVVAQAIEAGYRHIDTGLKYKNERGVGRGVAASGIAREDVFVTTKLDGLHQGEDRAVEGLDSCLERLGMDYVDLLLIHWPLPARDLYVDTWHTFERLKNAGKARSIGVSNFKPAHLERLIADSTVVPAVNQIQLYPGVPRAEARAYDAAHGILTTSYSPLGKGGAPLELPVVLELARKYGKSPAQVVLRWHVELGLVTVPKTSNPDRLRENLDVFDFTLTAEEVASISAIDTGEGNDSDVTGH